MKTFEPIMSFLRGLSNSQKEMVAYFGAGVITLMIVFVYAGDKIHYVIQPNYSNDTQVETSSLSDTGATSYFQDNLSKAFSSLTDIFKSSTSSTDLNNAQVSTVITPDSPTASTSNITNDGLSKISDDVNKFNSQFGTSSAELLGQ